MKKLILIIFFGILFTIPAKAETLYEQQYETSGAGEIWNLLNEETADVMEDLGIDPGDYSWVNKLEPDGVFSGIWNFISEGAKGPMKAGFTMLSLLLIISAAGTFESIKIYEDALSYVFTLVTAVVMLTPLISFISTCGAAIKGVTTLMTGFVPVYAGILTSTGKSLTASGMSFLLLSASSAVSNIASYFVLPLMNCYLGVGLAGTLMPVGGLGRLNDGIKKAAMWALSLTLTVFVGILSVQTGVNRAADGLGVKTAKFMIGSFVPMVGGALSESLTTFLGSLELLRSSVGMFGIVAVAVIILPTLAELFLWRVVLFLLGIAADVLGVNEKSVMLRAADSVLSVMMGLLLFVGALFIISLAVVSGGKNG